MQIIQKTGSFDRLSLSCCPESKESAPPNNFDPLDLTDILIALGDIDSIECQKNQASEHYGSRLAEIREADRLIVEDFVTKMSSVTSRRDKRLIQELRSFHQDESSPYMSVSPINDNLDCLACMEGNPASAFAGGVFWLHIKYPEEYPISPPDIRFVTPVYHPNIDKDGTIYLDLLAEAWSPVIVTRTTLLSILSVLHNPIIDSFTSNETIAEKYEWDYNDYHETVRLYTEEYATPNKPDLAAL